MNAVRVRDRWQYLGRSWKENLGLIGAALAGGAFETSSNRVVAIAP
jgi:hypothetical protein